MSELACARVRRRSCVPGRERWDVEGLRRKPLLALEIETSLSTVTGILQARANPVSGRVLVRFDPHVVRTSVGALIGAAIERVSQTVHTAAVDGSTSPNTASREATVTDDRVLLQALGLTDASRMPRVRGVVLSLANTGASLAAPLGLGLMMAVPTMGTLRWLRAIGLVSGPSQVVFLALVSLLGKAVALGLESRRRQYWMDYATTIEHRLRLRTFQHLEHLDIAYVENRSTGELMNLVYEDTAVIRRFLVRVPHSIIEKVTTIGVVSAFLFVMSPVLGLVSVLPLPLIYRSSRRAHRENAALHATLREQEDHIQRLLANALGGLSTVKSFASEAYEAERLETVDDGVARSLARTTTLSTRNDQRTKLSITIGIMGSMTYGSFLVFQGTYPLLLYVAQAFLVSRLMMTVDDLDGDHDLYQGASAAARRLVKVLTVRPTVATGTMPYPKESARGDIRIEDVSFGYDASTLVLHGVDLHISPHETVGFVGHSGAGKTTLAKLLLRFYDVDDGRILLDGIDIRALRLDDLRRAVGLVSQDVYLFDGTLYENIAYGRLEATDSEVRAAAREAGALDFIRALPDGFDTVVGERGQKLSGGQRQRVSIARAILKDPPILVLDEATSSVDAETEAEITRSIDRLCVDRTTILIAHRLSSVRHADRIYVLEHGQVGEHGTHQQLLDRDGPYADVWKLQTT